MVGTICSTFKGKVEAEMQLMLQEEATKTPVGKAREDPEALALPK